MRNAQREIEGLPWRDMVNKNPSADATIPGLNSLLLKPSMPTVRVRTRVLLTRTVARILIRQIHTIHTNGWTVVTHSQWPHTAWHQPGKPQIHLRTQNNSDTKNTIRRLRHDFITRKKSRQLMIDRWAYLITFQTPQTSCFSHQGWVTPLWLKQTTKVRYSLILIPPAAKINRLYWDCSYRPSS